MYNTRSSLYDCCLEKTSEQVFINSLRKEYELSPAESNGILELAKSCLFGEVSSMASGFRPWGLFCLRGSTPKIPFHPPAGQIEPAGGFVLLEYGGLLPLFYHGGKPPYSKKLNS